MQEVESKLISHVGYDEATQVLTVKFRTGATYEYPGVSTEDHKAFMGAESIGKHFSAHIRNKFSGQKAA